MTEQDCPVWVQLIGVGLILALGAVVYWLSPDMDPDSPNYGIAWIGHPVVRLVTLVGALIWAGIWYLSVLMRGK